MAINVQGAEIKATTETGLPMLKGSNNLIQVTISNPISIDLQSFAKNILPYLDGNDNVVNIDIIGAESDIVENIYIEDSDLVIQRKTLQGDEEKRYPLAYCKDGQLHSLLYDIDNKSITTTYDNVIGISGEPFVREVIDSTYKVITDNLGNILEIIRND